MEKGTSSALHSVRIYYENAPAAGSAGSEDAHGMTGETGCKITLGAPPTPFFPFDARSAPDSRKRACSTKATRAQGPPPGTRSERGEARAHLGEVVHDLSSRARP